MYKTVNDFPNYLVYDDGRVFTKKYNRFLKTSLNRAGYYRVTLCNNKIQKRIYVHRLVAIHFLPNLYNKPTVDHRNRITTDNRLVNLRWATHSEQNLNQKKRDFKPRGTNEANKKALVKARNIRWSVRNNPDYVSGNISRYPYGSYRVRWRDVENNKHQKTFKTLEEAQEFRDLPNVEKTKLLK